MNPFCVPKFHYCMFALAFVGHMITWLMSRSISVFPPAILYCTVFFLIASWLNTFAIFLLDDLHFAKPENRRRKPLYFIFPVLSLVFCWVVATQLSDDVRWGPKERIYVPNQ